MPKKRVEDSRYDRNYSRQCNPSYKSIKDNTAASTNILDQNQSDRNDPLFIETPKSSQKPRGTYGKHGITGFGRKFVRNASLLLEQKYRKERLGFVTCTLPAFSSQMLRSITGVWGEVVRRFFQKMRRQLAKLSQPLIYVSVTEIQEKRFAKYGDAAPHLHFVYVCRESRNSRYWLFVCQIHRAWNEALREGLAYCGYTYTMSPDLGWGSVHCARVRKSASAYLGKYMSKGVLVIKEMQEAGYEEFPRQWWSATTDVKKMFKESVIILRNAVASDLFYNLGRYLEEGLVKWASYVSVPIGGEDRTIGLVGTLSKIAYASMQC